ncbi:MAG: hypothetical protein ACT4OP_04800 [Actinomycetota bacterium]
MKLEERLRRQLTDTAEHLIISPGAYEETIRRGKRRRWAVVTSTVAGTVAVGAVVLGLVSFRPPAPIAPSATTTTGVPAPVEIAGVAVAGPEGVTVLSYDGQQVDLASDANYEGIAWVVGDGIGGLIFTHEVTPLPWPQGSIMRLRAGATAPLVIVAAKAGEHLRPLAVEQGLLLYRHDLEGVSRILTFDLSTGSTTEVVPPSERLVAASAASGLVVVAFGGDCGRLAYHHLDGTDAPVPPWDGGGCLPASLNDLAFTGEHLYTLEDSDIRRLVRRDFSTGESLAIEAGDAWAVDALPDGTVALGGAEVVVGRVNSERFDPIVRVPSANSFDLVTVGAFGENATLGSGLGELPCNPLDLPAPGPQGLPSAVETRRAELFTLAADCQMEHLAEIARAEATAFSFGGETDPLRSWIRSARLGFDVMTMMVRIFGATPVQGADGVYAWPAVHVTNAETDWQELSGILSAAEYEQLHGLADSGYLGLRIGIAPDGDWEYVIAGD